ncbi:mechanosensitive ion channel family protein [Halorubrum ejinorense]
MEMGTEPTQPIAEQTVQAVFDEFITGVVGAIPRIISGIVFLALAYVVIKVILLVTQAAFRRVYPVEEELVVDLSVAIVGIFLWFGAALALLKIVGMGEVATSLGSAAGFIGLGVAFALKDMIADTVAGVYLLRDEDFNHGDVVETASVTGTIIGIGLRKTRIRSGDGKTIVLANKDVEKKWTQHATGDASDVPGDATVSDAA